VCRSFLLPQIPVYTPSKHLHQTRKHMTLMSPYSLVNLCSKKLQIIENVLNTPWPRQPMRIWLDPLQTTLKANQTLNFTTNLSINRNIHDVGKLLFTHTSGKHEPLSIKTTFYSMAIQFILQRYAGKAVTRSWRHIHWSINSKKICKSFKMY